MLNDEFLKIVKENLSEKRFIHCANVSKEALKLAKRYGCDPQKAEIAGFLHDITKEFTRKEHLEIISKSDIKLTFAEEKSPKLLHAVSGYIYANSKLKIDDEEILNAIRYHTSGRANMSTLEKVVFVADFISEDRKYKTLGRIKYLASLSLDAAALCGIEYTVKSLIEKRSIVDPRGIEAYNSILSETEARTIDD